MVSRYSSNFKLPAEKINNLQTIAVSQTNMYVVAVISSIRMQGSVLDHDNYNPKMCHAESGNLMSSHYTMYLMQLSPYIPVNDCD